MWCTTVHRLSACNKISLFGGKIPREVVQNMEILQANGAADSPGNLTASGWGSLGRGTSIHHPGKASRGSRLPDPVRVDGTGAPHCHILPGGA